MAYQFPLIDTNVAAINAEYRGAVRSLNCVGQRQREGRGRGTGRAWGPAVIAVDNMSMSVAG